MAKVTQQDVISFLNEKVAQISRDLEFVQNAINVIEGTSSRYTAPQKDRKQATVKKAPSRTMKTAKTTGAKRGRKPKVKEMPSERIMAADQLG